VNNQSFSSDSEDDFIPLVVDLDGTLTPTDTLIEETIRLVKRNPLKGFLIPYRLLYGRAAFKSYIAVNSIFSAENLPLRQSFVDYLTTEKRKGRRIILATAAHRSIAEPVAAKLGLFEEVLASEGSLNLKGEAKLAAIRKSVGEPFAYAGDSAADLPIWKAAKAAVLVGVSSKIASTVRRDTPVEREFPRLETNAAVWVRALRIHQWLKNLLLFVPLLTAFSFLEPGKFITMSIAFLAFSFAASAGYVINDILDIDSDRLHLRKRNRPFANASITIPAGFLATVGLLAAACLLAATISVHFLAMLMVYLTFTSAYSWVFKQYVLIDVLMLSLLYTLRIISGSVAVDITTSSWLLAFSVFIFFSLALVKRCSELVSLGQIGHQAAHGRDYRVSDLVVLWPLGVGAALSSVVVFGLFISAQETQARYASSQLLWLVAFCLIYWLGHLWIKTARGEMYDDPLVFAVKDCVSRMTILIMILATLAAHFIDLG